MGTTTAAQNGTKHNSSSDDGLSDVIFGTGGAAIAVDADANENDVEGLKDDDDASAATGSDEDAAIASEGFDEGEGTSAEGEEDNADDDANDDDQADEDEEDEQDDSPAAKQARAKFTPEQQALFNKAMKKERARRTTEVASLQERLAQLEQQTATEKSPVPALTPTPENPLADVETEAQLEERIAGAKAWRQWLRLHPEGGTLGEGENAKEVTPEQARLWLVQYEDILLDHAPARRAYLEKRKAADADALKVHPWLAKASDPRTLAVEAELRAFPALRTVPGVRALIADAHLTRAARAVAQKRSASAAGGATTGKTGVARAPQNPAAGATRPPKASSGRLATKAVETLRKTGDDPGNALLTNAIFPTGKR